MLVILTDQGLAMHQVRGGYVIEGTFYKNYDLACDVFYSLMNADEVIIYEHWTTIRRV